MKQAVRIALAALLSIAGPLAGAVPPSSSAPPSMETAPRDTRISLGLDDAEAHALLSEMQQMLASIQGIIAGIGEEDRQRIIEAARYSGNRMARETPESIKKKTPAAFKQLGGPTHMMFEELVIRAETDDMDMLASFTGELMQQCLQCHAMFRAR